MAVTTASDDLTLTWGAGVTTTASDDITLSWTTNATTSASDDVVIHWQALTSSVFRYTGTTLVPVRIARWTGSTLEYLTP